MHLNNHSFQDISHMALVLTCILTAIKIAQNNAITTLKVKGQGHNTSAVKYFEFKAQYLSFWNTLALVLTRVLIFNHLE